MVLAGLISSGENHDSQTSDPLEPYTDEAQSQEVDAREILETDAGRLNEDIQRPVDQSADERLLTLFTRIQTLEREYSILHGRVEELEHLYQEERHMNRRRFLDIDRRLREQLGSELAPEDALTTEDINSETGMYRRGMAFVDAEEYIQALELFQQIVDTFPNGERVPDAMYWLAEIYRNVDPTDLEKSRQFFVQMVTLYSDHARIPEALAKLGMVYHELGNVTRALEYLDRVIAEFPDHDAARLAETYAQELR
ncbi:MAG: tetratricopeptide repeat protein [Gammaproteobacteria bacterium]|nr:tetratricopeptide repeat protein [Gammaproteobacteria bacterium]